MMYFVIPRRERNLVSHRIMFIDPAARLPVKFEDPSFFKQETRRYDATLKVEAPAVPLNFAGFSPPLGCERIVRTQIIPHEQNGTASPLSERAFANLKERSFAGRDCRLRGGYSAATIQQTQLPITIAALGIITTAMLMVRLPTLIKQSAYHQPSPWLILIEEMPFSKKGV